MSPTVYEVIPVPPFAAVSALVSVRVFMFAVPVAERPPRLSDPEKSTLPCTERVRVGEEVPTPKLPTLSKRATSTPFVLNPRVLIAGRYKLVPLIVAEVGANLAAVTVEVILAPPPTVRVPVALRFAPFTSPEKRPLP